MPDVRLDPAEIARRFAGMHDAIGADLAYFGGILRDRAILIPDEDLVTVESKTGTGLDTWDF